MLRLRLGLRLGPFAVTSDHRRRARVPSMPWVTFKVLSLPLAFGVGMALAWWVTR